MKTCSIIVLVLLAASLAAFAEDKKPEEKTCGKTVEECNKAWKADEDKITKMTSEENLLKNGIAYYINALKDANQKASGVILQ